ncbi:ribosome small subunit-dependent GTPase A [Jiangella ureilytica]|uniref:Small ribosomal subunit biogenesis GTPase RsgA n=1 Tax=Jiangella ureilytica TaxID=2530374 RepID=A0A4R4RCU1_9ACTN|nr:ribosome small subunit-dependent GTPase A [Jiangella ureilytica]TDC47101.1 ribosome small subunit-dependent GTPase A [Jiangella ureilytica]
MSAAQQRLLDLGWTPEVGRAFQPYRGAHRLARVCRVDRGGAALAGGMGAVRASFGGEVLRAVADDRLALPAVGDWTAVRDWPDDRVTLEAVLPRRTAIVRDSADRTSAGQVVAANVDVVVIVEHLDPDPDLGRIERLLVLAWGSGAQPIVVLTKSDLVPDPLGMRDEVAEVAPGVEILLVSSVLGDGVDELGALVRNGRTLALVGPSGAGKSTLTNLLAGVDVMPTGSVRARDGRGRHTTTHRELVVLPGRGVLIDTPGLRAVGLVADGGAVAGAFADVEAFAGQCRFRDCGHVTEPGCAVLLAVADGDLDEDRLARWRKLRREAALNAARRSGNRRAVVAELEARRHRR